MRMLITMMIIASFLAFAGSDLAMAKTNKVTTTTKGVNVVDKKDVKKHHVKEHHKKGHHKVKVEKKKVK